MFGALPYAETLQERYYTRQDDKVILDHKQHYV